MTASACRSEIQQSRRNLQPTERSLQQEAITRTLDSYPTLQRAEKYLSDDTCRQLNSINEKAGRTVPLSEIREGRAGITARITATQNKLRAIHQTGERLTGAKYWLESHENNVEQVAEMESPFAKAKRLFSKEAQRRYRDAINQMDYSKERMNAFGIRDRDDFNQQTKQYEHAAANAPQIREECKVLQSQLGLLDGILQGVERAIRSADREAMRQQQSQQQTKRRQPERGYER